jgi:hypothetical protein
MRTPLKHAVWILAVVATVAASLNAGAATVRRLQLDEIRDGSAAVFWGQVVERSTRIDDRGRMVWTDYRISVSEHLLGENPGTAAIISFAGGTKGDVSVGIHGMPRLDIGKTYVFFVRPDRPDGGSYINGTIGWGQGLYRIERVELDGKTQDLLVSYDGEPLEMSDDGRIRRGPHVKIEEGRVVDIRARRADGVTRASDPTFTTPSGKPIPQHWTSRSEAPVRQRNFATLEDLRAFVEGRIEAVTSSPRVK